MTEEEMDDHEWELKYGDPYHEPESYEHVYVTVCEQVFNSHSAGRDHERHCPFCRVRQKQRRIR